MRISKTMQGTGQMPSASPHRTPTRTWLPLLTLALIAIVTGGIILQIWRVDAPAGGSALSPAAPAPFTPTAPPPETPTATAPEPSISLETLYIDIAPDDLAQLEAKRAEALESWILLTSDEDFVPATLRLGETQYAADIRLKGDWADHIAHDKWSFRIELRGDEYLHGMQVFSIHDPSARVYLNEHLFFKNLSYEDVLGVRYDFLRIVLNGEYKGIYALEEGFAKELLEFQQRRESVIIRYAEDLLWQAWAAYDDNVVPPGLTSFYLIDDFNSAQIDSSPTLSAQRDTAIRLLRGFTTGELPATEVFDLERMGKFLALSDLWSTLHGLKWHNLRYYYNPVTSRLEPVAFDNAPFSPELDFDDVGLDSESFYHDPHLQAAYARALWEVSQPSYLTTLEERLEPEYERLRAELEPEFGEAVLAAPWDLLWRRGDLNRQRMSPIQTAYAYRVAPVDLTAMSIPSDTVVLEIGNLLDLPVEIVGIRVGELSTTAQQAAEMAAPTTAWVDPTSWSYIVPPIAGNPESIVLRALEQDQAALPYVRLTTPLRAPAGTDIQLLTRVWGLTRTLTQTVISSYVLPAAQSPRPTTPSLDTVLKRHPYLQPATEPNWLTIPEGVWEISGTLTLPSGYGLQLGPGTTLEFDEDGFLLASGPLLFLGTAEAPVVLKPYGETWLGIAVLDAGAPSLWQYVTIENTNAIQHEGWTFTGGVTFHRSSVHISHVHFAGTRAEDALNIIRTTYEIIDTEFSNTASDAFDGDFTTGTIERCIFTDIGADGIDVSGSDLTVQNVRFYNLGDKGLSIGEASHATAQGITATGAAFVAVSKDASSLTITSVSARDITVAALAAYTKKSAYGPATMTVDNIDFGNAPPERQTLVQTGSHIDLNGQRIWGIDIDVDALYEAQQQP